MNKIGRIGIFTLSVSTLLVVAGLSYVKLALPNVGPAPELAVRTDSATVARGKYIAHHVALCVDCHSTRDWTRLNAPLVAGTEGKGGEGFLREAGFPGNYYAPNLTPAHLGNWTDGEIFRAITTGVSKDGHALFPVMPYPNYAQMDPDDIKAVIAYVRTLRPIPNPVPASESDFPMNFIINTIPAQHTPAPRPDPADRLAYGKYLTTFASCADCHTKMDEQGQPVADMAFAGGNEYVLPTGTVRSMNITPARTGIGAWTKAAFVARFKAHANVVTTGPGATTLPATTSAADTVEEGGFNSIMPWTMYAGMSEQDLGAIYDYLRTVKPVENAVVRFTPRPAPVASR